MGGGFMAFFIFHYSVSTERGRLEDEVGCSGIVWFTQVAISQLFIDQLAQRGKGEGWVFEVAKGIRGRVFEDDLCAITKLNDSLILI